MAENENPKSLFDILNEQEGTFDVTLTSFVYEQISSAASILGVTVEEFVTSVSMTASTKVIVEEAKRLLFG